MKVTRMCLLVLPLIGAALLPSGATSASERFERGGILKVEKECTGFDGAPGSFCTVTSANVPWIPVGTKIRYGQPEGLPGLGIDSNVVLDAGDGNAAVGRCTLGATFGLCTFSDGVGKLAGFTARVSVTTSDFINWQWLGTYEFKEIKGESPRR